MHHISGAGFTPVFRCFVFIALAVLLFVLRLEMTVDIETVIFRLYFQSQPLSLNLNQKSINYLS
jgi:hypothetical protein